MGAPRGEPVQEFFSIGDVCALTDLKPHVLRYWESQFKLLNPAKNRSGNRVYARREVELIQLVKHLLYTEKYTIDGARQKLEEFRKGGAVRPAARAALEVEMLESVERDLLDLMQFLAEPAGADADTDAAASPGVSRAS
jgi:DNA-binding transcriptional MerR regulator